MKRVSSSTRSLRLRAALLLGAGACLAAAAPACAQQESAATARVSFAISPQPLVDAMREFSRATGIQVAYAASVGSGVSSPGASGTMSAAEALSQLLAGTGLTFRFTGPNAVTLERPPAQTADGAIQLGPVRVEGEALTGFVPPAQAQIGNLPPTYPGGQVARGAQVGVLGNRDIMDTPFNQVAYTAKKVEDQQARSLIDVLIDHPSVQIMSPRSGSNLDLYAMRGFQFPSVLYGGLIGMLGTDTVMPEIAERIEVLTGPSSVLSGNLGMGGTVNVIPKRAPDETLIRLTPSYSSASNFGGHADVGIRFGANKEFGARFNGVYRDGETAVKDISDERGLAVLGLDYRGSRVRLSADLGYQQQRLDGVIPRLQLAAGVPVVPKVPDTGRNPGVPWTYKDQEDKFAILRGEFDLTEALTFYAAYGHHDWQRSFLNNRLTITNVSGAANGSTILSNFAEDHDTLEAGLRGRFDTGAVSHEFAVSGTLYKYHYTVGEAYGPAFATNIYAPVIPSAPSLTLPVSLGYIDSKRTSFAVADTLSVLDKRIQLTLGARLQKIDTDNFGYTTGIPVNQYAKDAFSPSIGLVVKPVDNVSLYANYATGLEEGEIVGPTFANAGTAFPPYKSKQYEAGVKVDLGSWTATFSAFQIAKPSVLTDVASNSRILDGEQRNRGLEFNILGEPVRGLRLLGGVMLLDADLTNTQGGLTDGWRAAAAPEVQVRLSGEWDVPFLTGLTLTGRVSHTSRQYIDTLTPRRFIPDWTRIDAGFRYSLPEASSPTGKPLVLRLNVENLAGKDFWMSPNVFGPPRTVWASVSIDF